jgi:hypothetical protein
MAEAGGKSITIVWIWLNEALALAVKALGSVALAKERLTEWLAAGELPSSCTSWEGPVVEGIAKGDEQLRQVGSTTPILPPKFWRAPHQIDWENNEAVELETGRGFVLAATTIDARTAFLHCWPRAKARGVKVSHLHLLALLPAPPPQARSRRPTSLHLLLLSAGRREQSQNMIGTRFRLVVISGSTTTAFPTM